jgi:hypothetical protein
MKQGTPLSIIKSILKLSYSSRFFGIDIVSYEIGKGTMDYFEDDPKYKKDGSEWRKKFSKDAFIEDIDESYRQNFELINKNSTLSIYISLDFHEM